MPRKNPIASSNFFIKTGKHSFGFFKIDYEKPITIPLVDFGKNC